MRLRCVWRACRRGRGHAARALAFVWRSLRACHGSHQDKIGAQDVGSLIFGSPRTDWPDLVACRACPAQRAFARYLPPDRRELSGHWRAGRLAQHLAPDRGSAVAGLGSQCDGRSRSARADLCAAYLGRTVADRNRPQLLCRCLDAGRRSHRSRTAIDPDPACFRRQGAIGRGGTRRGADAALRPDARGRRGADRQIQFAAEAYRIRSPRAGAGPRRAGRRRRPGRKSRAGLAARRSFFGADRSDQFPQCADQGPDAGGSAPRT